MRYLARLMATVFAGVVLASCGGGGGGSGPTTVDLTAPPSINTASDAPLQIKAVYQPDVRSLGNDPAGPQLVEASAGGQLRFSGPTNAKVGDVLIVGGKGYVVTAVEQGGVILQTRVPELGQVFQTLSIRGTLEAGAAPAAATLSSVLKSGKFSLGDVDGKLSYSYDFFMLPEIKATLGVNVGLKGEIKYDYQASKGVSEFDFSATVDLGEFINITYDTSNGAPGKSDGIEVKRWIFPISQIPGVATLEIPLMVSAQYTGEAKTSVALQSGATQYVITAHLNKSTGQIETTGTLSGSSTAGAPTLASPIQVGTTSTLGLGFKVGPDVQFKLLAGTFSPITVAARGVTDLSGGAINDGTQTCLGWTIELKGELGAELKLTEALKMGATYETPGAELSKGGNLDACQPPSPTPPPTTPTTPPPTTPPADAVSTPEGEVLLPSPVGLPMLTDYDFRLVVNRPDFAFDPVSTYCTDVYLYGQGAGIAPTWTSCQAGVEATFYSPGSAVPWGGDPAEQFWEGVPLSYAYESGVCRFSAPVYDQLAYVDSGVLTYRQYNGKTVEFDARSALRFANIRVRPILSPVIRRVVSGASQYQTYTFRYVCQMVLAKRSNPTERYYVRAEKVFSDFYALSSPDLANAAGFVTLK